MLRGILMTMRMVATVPATSSSAGQAGDFVLDVPNGWLYICFAVNQWVRHSVTTF